MKLLCFILCIVSGIAMAERSDTEKAPSKLEPIQVGAPQRIEVLPKAIQLGTPLRKVQLLVSGFYADGRVQDLTRAAEFKFAAEGIARIGDELVSPITDGKTELTVRVGGYVFTPEVEAS